MEKSIRMVIELIYNNRGYKPPNIEVVAEGKDYKVLFNIKESKIKVGTFFEIVKEINKAMEQNFMLKIKRDEINKEAYTMLLSPFQYNGTEI